jgi:hypothetical protein
MGSYAGGKAKEELEPRGLYDEESYGTQAK